MSIENKLPGYEAIEQLLQQHQVALTAAEMHGLISGILCGGNHDDSWKTLVSELTNDGLSFPQVLAQPLLEIYQITRNTLDDEGFMFQLFLPDDTQDNVTVFERADGLAGWVNHFLLGLGVVQPRLDKTQGELKEAIGDLRNIAQLGYDEDEDQDQLAQSLEEVVEYVRVAAILCHNEFTHPVVTAPEQKPTLH
ncbi:YecA family protein [Lonsdalea britannica]|uniref:YecA/YgfB family protein n=1 Tax=Lonsdalea britannica TaxID=1082704 RepID=UPI0026EBD966|nr:YecA family protein [Lonsdalea britannica]